jgi:catechol 2,3-dioxygenase-like lactoylglutathione lyase family enzyme
MRTIKNLFHISLQVNDFNKSLDFYCNKLGLEQMFMLTVYDFKKMLGFEITGENNDEPWLTYLRIQKEQYLEIFDRVLNPEVSPDLSRKSLVRKYGDSPFSCIVFDVEDLSLTVSRLQAKGVRVFGEKDAEGDVKLALSIYDKYQCKSAYIFDPDGNLIILFQQDADPVFKQFEDQYS